MSMAGHKAIFLDRDGTINKDRHYISKVEDFEYIEGVIDGLRKLQEHDFLIVIITNQSGIARGYYSELDYYILDNWMKKDLADKGIVITASYYCPHLPGGIVSQYAMECNCRKPKTGLFWKAAKDLNIDMNSSYAIGDKLRDLSICEESGVRGILFGNDDSGAGKYPGFYDWKCIVEYILECDKEQSFDKRID